MSRSPQIPHGAVNLCTCTELEAKAEAFVGDHCDVLLIVGRPSVSKSEYSTQRARKHRKVACLLSTPQLPVSSFQ